MNMMEEARRAPSKYEHCRSMQILAQTGPMTQSMNAEKDPRNAINVENSGTSMETVTASKVRAIRSKTIKMGREVFLTDVDKAAADLLVGDGVRDCCG
jgi:hypothetical protein